MTYHNCPCCSNSLLRHFRSGKIYWFCSGCHQDMPILENALISRNHFNNLRNPAVKTATRSDRTPVAAGYFVQLSDTLVPVTSR